MGPEGKTTRTSEKFTICAGASGWLRSASMPTNCPDQAVRGSAASLEVPSAMIFRRLAGF